jgi:hypothetical protein
MMEASLPNFQPTSPQPSSQSVNVSQPQDIPEELQPETVLLEWTAPVRPFKKRNRQYYTTIAILVGLVSLILFLAGQFLFIAVILAFAFVNYVLSTVPPQDVVNKITTYGIRSDQVIYYWNEMGRFWYAQKYGQNLLHIEVARFPNHLTLLLGDVQPDQITPFLSQILLQEKPLPTTFDKIAAWLEENIPLDK